MPKTIAEHISAPIPAMFLKWGIFSSIKLQRQDTDRLLTPVRCCQQFSLCSDQQQGLLRVSEATLCYQLS